MLFVPPLVCRHLLLFLTSPPEKGERNIRETKVQSAKVATLTSSCPYPSAALNTVIAVGHRRRERREPCPGGCPGKAVVACHAFAEPVLVAENARMMSPTRLAGTLIPAMAFLSCLRPESWNPYVQVRVRGQFISCALCLVSEKLPFAQSFSLCALVSFVSKRESNYLKDLRSQRDQIIPVIRH